MALVNVGDTWIGGGLEGTITYQNGNTAEYTYGSTGTDATNASYGTLLNEGSQAFVNFTNGDAVGLVVELKLIQDTEGAIFRLDGASFDLSQMITDGDVTVLSGAPLDIYAGAHVRGNASGDPIILQFNVPVGTLSISPDIHNGNSADPSFYVNYHIEDTADQPAYPCFIAGTLIDTDQGAVPVETLQTGDMIKTKDHGFQPVKWVGASRVYVSGFDVPLRIKKGTFGNTRDLVVSKRHKMLMNHTHLSLMFDVEEAFACAMHLRNDDTITREPEGWVTYYHVLLPQHEVIYAEGAATESFYPDEGTLAGMASKTKEELLTHFDPTTYGPQARLTFDPMRAMWIGRNLDILQGDDMGQIAAYENAMKAAQ